MSKDPAFLFYPNDYIGGTMGMTFEEKGAYMELLMMQFNRGHMTTHMIGQTVGQLWDTIKVKFIQDTDGLWYNDRLEIEQTKRKNFTESRRNNVKGDNQYTKKPSKKCGHIDGHTTPRMEDENINRIGIREELFKTEVFKFKNYPTNTLNEFITFWTEPNKSHSKMRWEMEKTWDLKRRLSRWSSNDFSKKTAYKSKRKNTPDVERRLNEDYNDSKYNIENIGIKIEAPITHKKDPLIK